MKILSIMVIAPFLLTSLSASTDLNLKQVNTSKILKTSSTSTREAAYWLGASKLASLKQSSPRQLDLILGNGGDIIMETLHFHEGSKVTVEEKVNANGEREFVGLVKIAFGYTEKDNDL